MADFCDDGDKPGFIRNSRDLITFTSLYIGFKKQRKFIQESTLKVQSFKV
jgi:hypothetical protein